MTYAELIRSGKHLPAPLRDFHDQKDVFKSLHEWMNRGCVADFRNCVPELPQVSALPSLVQMNEAITEHALVITEALGPSKSALEGIETVSAAQVKLKALVLQLYAAAIYPSDKRTEVKMVINTADPNALARRVLASASEITKRVPSHED